jgi:hypothetical protein
VSTYATVAIGEALPRTRAIKAKRVRSISAAAKPTAAPVKPRSRNASTSDQGPPTKRAASDDQATQLSVRLTNAPLDRRGRLNPNDAFSAHSPARQLPSVGSPVSVAPIRIRTHVENAQTLPEVRTAPPREAERPAWSWANCSRSIRPRNPTYSSWPRAPCPALMPSSASSAHSGKARPHRVGGATVEAAGGLSPMPVPAAAPPPFARTRAKGKLVSPQSCRVSVRRS